MKRVHYAALFVCSCTFACGAVPFVASADTVIGPDAEISESVTWAKEGSPYIVQGSLTVNASTTLTIEPGVIVRFESNSWIDILGTLLAQGTAENPIHFLSEDESRWGGLQFENQNVASSLDHVTIRYARTGISDYHSKDLSLSNISITDGKYGIEAVGSHLSVDTLSVENMSSEALDIRDGSDVTLSNLTLKNVDMSVQIYFNSVANISNLLIDGASGEALAVYVGSHARVASSTIKNVSNSYGAVEAFVDSSLDITGLTLENVSDGDALSVFNNSQMTVRDSSILYTDNYEVAVAFSSSTLIFRQTRIVGGTGDGVAIFGGGSIDMQDSVISEFTDGAGIADYGSWPHQPANSISLTRSEITGNAVGIGLYSGKSTYSISNNSIHNNATNGLESYGTAPVDVSNNYWGDPSGPREDPDNLTGIGNGISFDPTVSPVVFSPWLTSDPLAPDPCAVPGACVSNVLFLPGIEASRLYRPVEGCDSSISDCADHKLWDPSSDSDLSDLGLDISGESVRGDVYVKEGDIVSSASAFGVTKKFYEDFVAQMNTLKAGGTITDWEPIAYDWRLSLTGLIDKGAERGGKIFYEEATSTPYIEQTLRSLAASSKTKKVTIIAHSNGGLLAKALVKKLGASEAENLIDDIIFVGVPQSGAPQAVGGLLFGYGQALPRDDCSQLFLVGSLCSSLASRAAARSLAEHSPMAYHLLPSDAYFASVQDPTHSVASFTGAHEYQKEQQAYGTTIDDFSELSDFLQAKEGGRTNPAPEDTSRPGILNDALLEYAKGEHDVLDLWTPPAGITLYQIAGWGVDTISGISFYESSKLFGLLGTTPKYRPIFVEDGDGVVPVPSALLTSTSTENVKRYWIDLAKINNLPGSHAKYDHGDIFEASPLQDFIKNILNSSIDQLPNYISSDQPPTNVENKKLTFFLHSPLTLQLEDADGNITGLALDGSISQDIPGSTYGQFGEVKYIIAPAGSYSLSMHGQDNGTFSLDMQESSGGVITTSSTIANVPTTGNTLASLTISGGVDTASSLTVDENGDGTSIITITPQMGETVNYEPPALVPEPAKSSAGGRGGGGRSISIPAIIPVTATTTADILVMTTQIIATTTPEVATSIKSVQIKKKARVSATPPRKVITNFPSQTASVYDAASQQPLFAHLGAVIYNGLHGFWLALKSFF